MHVYHLTKFKPVLCIPRDGKVSLSEYMSFMISRETENVHSSKDVENAFKALTEGADKDFVTEQELYQVCNLCVSCMNWFPCD